jgi:enoyl-CoA hydratase/carnithine racemase
VRKPLIAAVNGPAAGLGLIQALLCDIRFAASDAKLTTSFARLTDGNGDDQSAASPRREQ